MNGAGTSGDAGAGIGLDLTQFYAVFFEEAHENLTNMESLLLELDTDVPDDEALNAIFRCAHSIKGGAATFGFNDVAELTHVMETLLDRLRRHEIELQPAMVDTLLASGDALRELLARHRGEPGEPPDHASLVERIRGLASGAPETDQSPVARVAEFTAPVTPAPATATSTPEPAGAPAAGQPPGDRRLDVVLEPSADASVVNLLLELFRDISGLAEVEASADPDAGAQARRIRIRTKSSDEDLYDLFSFHVDRKHVRLVAVEDNEAVEDRATVEAVESASVDGGEVDSKPESADEGWGLFQAGADVPARAASRAATGQAIVPAPTALPVAPASKPATSPAGTKNNKAAERPGVMESSTLRVSVEKVDQLINLVGELVITQAMLAQTGRSLDSIEHQAMMSALTDLERNTRLLQESVMAIRMIPMSTVFSRFPRMIRDLASKLGKQVELKTVGEGTELDKGMIEKITDPLTHLVRNAADHGIELPAERTAAGKNPTGRITLSAQHRGGSIVIEVRDDGKGLDRDRLVAKARERGIDVSDSISDQEAWNLIFEPGFSTAEAVTDVSGRGVGMDVVRKNILALGGTVELDSALGYGSCVSVRLPLTLAIMDGMSVGVSSETYIVPLGSVVESINLDESQVRSVAGSNRVLEVRNEYLPVVKLEDMFGVPRDDNKDANSTVIVVESENQRVALLVDELIGQHQIVVKNLEANYRKVPGVSGATIMGDGRVALILDIPHLVRRTRH